MKAALMVIIGVLGVLAILSGFWLDARILGNKAKWLNWIVGIGCGLFVTAEVFMVLYTYYAYRWFTDQWVLELAIALPVGIVIGVVWAETDDHPWWRAWLIFLLIVLICGGTGAPAPT